MRAWVMMTPQGIDVGGEHLRCPNTVELEADEAYVAQSAANAKASYKAVVRALDLATDAIEPWWLHVLRVLARVLWFLRGPVGRLCDARCWCFKGPFDHRSYDACTWSALLEVVEPRRPLAAATARAVLELHGYHVLDQAFNLPPGAVPTVR